MSLSLFLFLSVLSCAFATAPSHQIRTDSTESALRRCQKELRSTIEEVAMYKELYENEYADNSELKSQLQEAQIRIDVLENSIGSLKANKAMLWKQLQDQEQH